MRYQFSKDYDINICPKEDFFNLFMNGLKKHGHKILRNNGQDEIITVHGSYQAADVAFNPHMKKIMTFVLRERAGGIHASIIIRIGRLYIVTDSKDRSDLDSILCNYSDQLLNILKGGAEGELAFMEPTVLDRLNMRKKSSWSKILVGSMMLPVGIILLFISVSLTSGQYQPFQWLLGPLSAFLIIVGGWIVISNLFFYLDIIRYLMNN